MATLRDSFETNNDSRQLYASGTGDLVIKMGQTVTSNGTSEYLHSCSFLLSKGGTPGLPTGNMWAILTAMGGTWDATGIGSATVHATSATRDIVSDLGLTTSLAWYTFTFPEPLFQLDTGTATHYALCACFEGGDNNNYVNMGINNVGTGKAGNFTRYISSWQYDINKDTNFRLYEEAGITPISINVAPGTAFQIPGPLIVRP